MNCIFNEKGIDDDHTKEWSEIAKIQYLQFAVQYDDIFGNVAACSLHIVYFYRFSVV